MVFIKKYGIDIVGHEAAMKKTQVSIEDLKGAEGPTSPINVTDFRSVYVSTPNHRVQLIRHGVMPAEVKLILDEMDVPKERFFKYLRLSPSTVNRKARLGEGLSTEDSERVVGLSKLIGQVEIMVEKSGNIAGFNPSQWLAQWLETPLPALGWERPADYLDTLEGQRLISNLLATMQSGAYV